MHDQWKSIAGTTKDPVIYLLSTPGAPLNIAQRFALSTLVVCILSACGSDPVTDSAGGPAAITDTGSTTDIDLSGPDAITPETDAEPADTADDDVDAGVEPEDTAVTLDVDEPVDAVVVEDTTEPPTDTATEEDTGLPTNPVDPFVDGIYTVTTSNVRVPDSSGGEREAVLFVPASDVLTPLPAVVFSHGFQLSGSSYTEYAQRMASHGIIVLLPTWGDSLFSARSHVDLANDVETMLSWLIQQNAPGGAFEGRLDLLGLGAGGHSRGGKQSILAAVNDERIQALFTLDPVDSGPPGPLTNPTDYPSVTPEQMSGITVPFGTVGAGLGGTTTIPFSPACAPEADNFQAYYDELTGTGNLYVVADAGHNDFLYRCNGFACNACPGGDDAEFMRDLSAALMTAFFRFHLSDDDRYAPFLTGGQLDEWVSEGTLRYETR